MEPRSANKPIYVGTDGCLELANRVLELSNEAREKHGLDRLRLREPLNQAAESHSKDMLRKNYFSHTSPTPGREGVRLRVKAEGIDPVRVTEDIYQCIGYPPERVPLLAILAWLESPRNREAILNPRHRDVGIGVAVKGSQVYVTQVFSGDS